MRLPFVSRAMHDARVESYHCDLNRAIDSADSFKTLWEAERLRNERLVEKLLAMKQQGFQTATERQMPTPLPASRIDMAIDDRAGSNAALRRHLYRWAAGQQASKVSEDVIVDRLTTWQSDEGAEA
jgi:hypothetical protein